MSTLTTSGTMRSALRNRDFRRLISAFTVSQVGDWLYNVALLVLVYDRTHSALWVSATTAARVIPMVVLGPLGGLVADRFDRRRTMIVSDLVRAASMLTLVGVPLLGWPILLAPVIAALTTAAASPYPACAAASTARIVEDVNLPAANALRALITPLCLVGGPALGAVLLMLSTPAAAFAVNAATFTLSAVFVAAIPSGSAFRPSPAQLPYQGVVAELTSGFSALRRHPVAGRLVGADTACSVVYGAQTVLLVLISRRLGWSEQGYGVLIAAAGAGGVLGGLTAGRLSARCSLRRIVAGSLLLIALCLLLLAVAPSMAAAAVLAAAGGAAATVTEIFTETVLQRQLEEAVFAKAYGFAFPVAIAGIAVGSMIAAPLVGLFGLNGALAAIGIAVASFALFLGRSLAPRAGTPAADRATAAQLAAVG